MHIKTYRGDRASLRYLFALADDSESQVSAYIELGDVLIAHDGDTILGHLQFLETKQAGVFELKNMAVDSGCQRSGIGSRLVAAAISRCRTRYARRLIVSTATADVGNLRFYQRQGFRMYRIVQDAFRADTGYPEEVLIDGIPLRDQAFLEFWL